MQLGQAIAQIRKERGLTQEAFAKMYNVTRQTVSNWENEKSYPDLSTLVKISDEFNVSLDILLKGDFRMVKDIDKKIKKQPFYIGIIIGLVIIVVALFSFIYANDQRLSGKINVGRKGRAKVKEVLDYVKEKMPSLIDKKTDRIYLGKFHDYELIYVTSKEFISFFDNLISYVLVLEEFRRIKTQ